MPVPPSLARRAAQRRNRANYLLCHTFYVIGFQNMNREDIAAVIDRVPQLAYFGVGLYESPITSEKLRQGREQLLESSAICTKVCEWLASIKRSKTINRERNSYGLKHMAEQEIGEYVSNGVLIAAAIHSGFAYRLDGDSPYMMFGMSERSLNEKESATLSRRRRPQKTSVCAVDTLM
jgi:hypothetical protein